MAGQLFHEGIPEADSQDEKSAAGGTPRLRYACRNQRPLTPLSLEELLPQDHAARAVWKVVCGVDLGHWLKDIGAVEGGPGRPATDPRVLVALWVYATLEGFSSSRAIERWSSEGGEIGFRWLRGELSLSHATINRFRTSQPEGWDDMLTQIVGSLLYTGVASLHTVAQDGMRVRADAGTSSFRRRATLEECLAEARQQVATLRQLSAEEAGEIDRRKQAARERAAREREQRVEEAIRHCEELQRQRDQRGKTSNETVKEARASTTDPEARSMKFPNSGFGPGHNVQFCTDVNSGVILGVNVTNAGNDGAAHPEMLKQLVERYGRVPDNVLVDGGFATKETIEQATAQGCRIYAPLKDVAKQVKKGVNPYERRKGDSPAVADWRVRMGTDEAKEIYKRRAQTAEWVNAMARNRGYYSTPVRGVAKTRTISVIFAISHNIDRQLSLGRKEAGAAPPKQ